MSVSKCHNRSVTLSRYKKMPKEYKKKLPQFTPYSKGSPCTLYTKPKLLNPRGEDGQLDTSTQILSYKWVDACLKCQKGDKIKEGLWLKKADVKDQKRNPNKTLRYFLFEFKDCSCCNKYHTIDKIENLDEQATPVEPPDTGSPVSEEGSPVPETMYFLKGP